MSQRILLVAACTFLACSGGDPHQDAETDGGVDARPVASDAGLDTSVDTLPDAWIAPDDPGWVRLPGFPDDCFVERARQPEAVLAFRWDACLDLLPMCRMAVVDRSIAPLDRPTVIQGGNAMHGLLVWRLLESSREHVVLVVTRDDAPVLAWRQPYLVTTVSCLPALAVSDLGVGFDGAYLRSDGSGQDRVTTAAWSNFATLDSPVWQSTPDLVPRATFVETPSASDTTFAGTLTTGAILAVEPPNAAILGHGDLNPVVVGHAVLWNWADATGATGIHLSRIGGSEVELYRSPSGTALSGVRADGSWISWRSGTSGSSPALNELWAAPYTETPPLSPRRLWTDILGTYNGTIGDGMFAYTGPDASGTMPAIKVVDLAEGTRREYVFPAPAASGDGWYFETDAAWVTRDEVAIPMHRAQGGEILHTVVRVDLRGLAVESLPAVLDAGVDGGP